MNNLNLSQDFCNFNQDLQVPLLSGSEKDLFSLGYSQELFGASSLQLSLEQPFPPIKMNIQLNTTIGTPPSSPKKRKITHTPNPRPGKKVRTISPSNKNPTLEERIESVKKEIIEVNQGISTKTRARKNDEKALKEIQNLFKEGKRKQAEKNLKELEQRLRNRLSSRKTRIDKLKEKEANNRLIKQLKEQVKTLTEENQRLKEQLAQNSGS